MSTATLALRAPDYMKIVSGLIAAHGWCGSAKTAIGNGQPPGLDLVRASMWAVAGRECLARDLSDTEAEHVADLIDHLEADRGLGMSVIDYQRRFAGASARNVSLAILIAACRYTTDLI